jgi:hypothetical protein
MKRSAFLLFFGLFFLFFIIQPADLPARKAPRPLLPDEIVVALANEVSGARATHHIIEWGAYPRDRSEKEFRGTYFESAYVLEKLKEYGFSGAHIERFPSMRPMWDGRRGELWMLKPYRRCLIRYSEITTALAPFSASGTWTGKLVYVGDGNKDSDYEGKDIKGNIVLGKASPSTLYRLGVVKYGAAGVLSFGTHHPFDFPDKLAWGSLPMQAFTGEPFPGDSLPAPRSFAFNLSFRMGTELISLLSDLRPGEEILLKAIVEADTLQADNEVVTAVIPGQTDEEVVVTAHLFEGVYKQGANDNFSGSAAILEMGRALIRLMRQGVLPKPRRTIRFLWVPEISGTFQYLIRYPEEAKRMVVNINLDMVGENVYINRNTLNLYLNPYSRAHCVDDIAAELMEWVGLTNREMLQNRRERERILFPIVDPLGTTDPFLYNIEPYYGSSDHIVFLMHEFKVPAAFFNNWPDVGYHTSADRPFSNDPTQLKRSIFIAGALTTIMADFGQHDFTQLASVCFARAGSRLGQFYRDQVDSLLAAPAEEMATAYRDARYILEAHIARELEDLASVKMLIRNKEQDGAYLRQLQQSLARLGKDYLMALDRSYREICRQKGVKAIRPKKSQIERELARWVARDVERPLPEEGNLGSIFRRFFRSGVPGVKLSRGVQQELRYFVNGKRTLLEIRNGVSAEFGPVPMDQVKRFFEKLQERGDIQLVKK